MTRQWGWRVRWHGNEGRNGKLEDWIAVTDWFDRGTEEQDFTETTIVWWDTEDVND